MQEAKIQTSPAHQTLIKLLQQLSLQYKFYKAFWLLLIIWTPAFQMSDLELLPSLRELKWQNWEKLQVPELTLPFLRQSE